jgi:hypothetical protein
MADEPRIQELVGYADAGDHRVGIEATSYRRRNHSSSWSTYWADVGPPDSGLPVSM